MNRLIANPPDQDAAVEGRISALIEQMTLHEKIGQMSQVDANHARAPERLGEKLRAGRVGSVVNQVDVGIVNELQRIAVEESRLGIPLLVGRDVIHGFTTVMPIPLGQAATWHPALVCAGARVAAAEAAAAGVNWTFAPMIDIARDPRWGRIAESFGEDPYLTSRLGVAMIEGFQGDDLRADGNIAACAKHFAGYGAAEGGRDYGTASIPENELRNVYLPPFRAAVRAGVSSLMTSFSELNGVPASANRFLLTGILREEWGFRGFVVSDWDSIRQLSTHGLTVDDRDSAREAADAGVDMEMVGDAYHDHLAALVEEGRIAITKVDAAVANILRVKFFLGLFESPYTHPDRIPDVGRKEKLSVAKRLAAQSVVLLKNDGAVLPLSKERIDSLAVIGPLADAAHDQLGTWIFDGDPDLSITGLEGLRALLDDDVEINYVRAMETSRSGSTASFDEAVSTASRSDAVILFLGEESILSGEAHSRADIGLPGAQASLVQSIRNCGKPLIAVILAGRPLTLADIVDDVDALLFAWHPGAMGGEAIAELLFGIQSPSGKLPASFPRMVGQVPIHYNRKNTGKPPSPDSVIHIDQIAAGAPQTSLGMTSFHLDAGYTPLYPFGFGLSYTEFEYDNLKLSAEEILQGEVFTVSVDVTNVGSMAADEVVQLYVRDLVANVTRPVKELKGFRRIRVEPGQTVSVEFELATNDLAFFGRDSTLIVEPGEFHLWVGGSSDSDLRTGFRLVETDSPDGPA